MAIVNHLSQNQYDRVPILIQGDHTHRTAETKAKHFLEPREGKGRDGSQMSTLQAFT